MSDGKITISLEDVNSAQVDAAVKRQEIATRMAAHQASVESSTVDAHRMNPQGLFRRSIVYMAVFGLLASLAAWGLGEIPHYFGEISFRHAQAWNRSWFVVVSLVVALGLGIAEPVVSRNWRTALINGVLGVVLACVGGLVVSLFVNDIYRFLLGGSSRDAAFVQQMFARGIGWAIFGFFVATAPGIVMRSWKKFGLGLAGGAIGGLLGGLLFDPICFLAAQTTLRFDYGIPARCVNVLGLGLGAAVATALLENLAKQGWLRVATGVITGKQFILYRNPTIIGSSPKSEIYLFKDPTVAARHAAINGVGGKYLVTALGGSTVLLNGHPVTQTQLKNGDQLKIGNTVFLFEARVAKRGTNR